MSRCSFRGETLPEPLPAEPFALLHQWLADARAAAAQPNPNAFALASADEDGRPSVRIVLCRGLDVVRGYLVFFTNYHSRKGLELSTNPRGAAVFHWDHLDRQVRIEGPVARSPAGESDAYFSQRPLGSRLGAWASQQSAPLADRADLLAAGHEQMKRFGVSVDTDLEHDRTVSVPRPPHWGGLRLWAARVELWLGDPNRFHDRAVWTRDLAPATIDGVPGFAPEPGAVGQWTATRLQP